MMMTATVVTATVCALSVSGFWLSDLQRRRDRRDARAVLAELEHVLMLIQGVQKHRGLGGQQTPQATRQREQLVHQLDRQWSDWDGGRLPQRFAAITSITRSLGMQWLNVRSAPMDFQAHSTLIDQLLSVLELWERHLLMLGSRAQLTLVNRCREIEDLARLRGLSVRAANHRICPIELQVPLRYLCQRVEASEESMRDHSVRLALKEIRQQLLDAPRVIIAPGRCFELLTPSIDRALDEVRRLFADNNAIGNSAVRREAIAPLLPPVGAPVN